VEPEMTKKDKREEGKGNTGFSLGREDMGNEVEKVIFRCKIKAEREEKKRIGKNSRRKKPPGRAGKHAFLQKNGTNTPQKPITREGGQ